MISRSRYWAHWSKNRSVSRKKLAYLLFRYYNFQKASPLVFSGWSRFQYSTLELCPLFRHFSNLLIYSFAIQFRRNMVYFDKNTISRPIQRRSAFDGKDTISGHCHACVDDSLREAAKEYALHRNHPCPKTACFAGFPQDAAAFCPQCHVTGRNTRLKEYFSTAR